MQGEFAPSREKPRRLPLSLRSGYPLRPNKQSVGGASYAKYCRQADEVRQALGLTDFTELDALFNYAYWGQAPDDEET